MKIVAKLFFYVGKLSYIYLVSVKQLLPRSRNQKNYNMTQTNTTNSYTRATMDSTDVYNYLKRLARKTSNDTIDCLAEALISSYSDDTDIDTRDLKEICVNRGYMTAMDYREMECHVTTSLRTVSLSEAHCD